MTDPDVIVVGAGAAGMTAAVHLASAGRSVVILEARDRIGGRIFTQHDPVCEAPVELGAEFIHGRPPEIWKPLQSRKIKITEVDGDNWCRQKGSLKGCESLSEVDEIMEKMDDRSPDESFLSFLNRCCPDTKVSSDLRQRALSYVSGFNAADPAKIGVHWLVEGMRAEEKIEGGRAFRSENGYENLIDIFRQQLLKAGVAVQTNSVANTVRWKKGHAEVTAVNSTGPFALKARCALVTLPLAVLQAPAGALGAVRFLPGLPPRKLDALRHLEMGKVIRVTLRFRGRFWRTIKPAKSSKSLANLSFLFSQDDWFPTWWTPMPKALPMITGWAPFRCAERLSGESSAFVIERALKALGRALGKSPGKVESMVETAYFHDWQIDPFSRGAYSYGLVGSDGAQQALGSPVEETLFFAGEATDASGHNGTVHGAIASGIRAAKEILHTQSR
jgi:monoamine oxidase